MITTDTNDIEQIAPTPWMPRDGAFIDDAKGRVVCACAGEKPQRTLRRDRIIACVNFCAGVPTEKLERDVRVGLLLRTHPDVARYIEDSNA